MVVVGNATMRDLVFGLDVEPIGRSPFRSTSETAWRAGEVASDRSLDRRAHELGILVHPRARIWGAPLIACHVGADAAADLVAMDGEVARVRGCWSTSAPTRRSSCPTGRGSWRSCPAGPAFEGGLVRYGMPGAEGAIEAVRHVDGAFTVRTIGDVEPQGICGSGLVDLLAELRRIGAMNERGAFTDGGASVTVVPDRGITLSRADASHLAQAKAANAVGMQVLLRILGLEAADLARLDLAGGFASSLDVSNAIAIGFLPAVPPSASCATATRPSAARRRCCSRAALALASRRRVARIEHVELEAEPDFFELFVDGCRLEPLPATGVPA